jgi:integrase
MPTARRDRHGRIRAFYIDREVAGYGRLYKSLHTRQRAEANYREGLLLELARAGRKRILDAFVAPGKLSIEVIAAAHAAGTLDTLATNPVHIRLADATRLALTAKEGQDVTPSTIQRYRESLNHFERLLGWDAPVAGVLTKHEIEGFTAARKRERAKAGTINNDLVAVQVLATYALERGWIKEKPKVTKMRADPRKRSLSDEERRRYLAALRPDYRTLMSLLLFTGMRLGEAEGLKVCDLKLDGTRPYLTVLTGKSRHAVRPVPLPACVVKELRARTKYMEPGDRVFRLARRTTQKEHRRACRQAKIPDYRIHDHRHTAAVSLAQSGVNMVLLQQQLGHGSQEQTSKYAWYQATQDDAVARAYREIETRLNGS